MKIAITKEAKQWITVADMPIVRRIIEDMKEDNGLKEYAEIAIRAAVEGTYSIDILRVQAEICGNRRVWDAYGEGTKTFDFWITATAQTNNGFVIIGANLTDIWKITGRRNDDAEYTAHMYTRLFREVKS